MTMMMKMVMMKVMVRLVAMVITPTSSFGNWLPQDYHQALMVAVPTVCVMIF
jgi:hypothetical protein